LDLLTANLRAIARVFAVIFEVHSIFIQEDQLTNRQFYPSYANVFVENVRKYQNLNHQNVLKYQNV
jgi:predicted SPOUT superfamily RNA methylase MTH1